MIWGVKSPNEPNCIKSIRLDNNENEQFQIKFKRNSLNSKLITPSAEAVVGVLPHDGDGGEVEYTGLGVEPGLHPQGRPQPRDQQPERDA